MTQEKPKMNHQERLSTAISIIASILTLVLTFVFAFFVIVQSFFPHKAMEFFSVRTFMISPTGSMRPTLEHNDFVIVKNVGFDNIVEGDIVTFRTYTTSGEEIIITHRVDEVVVDYTGRRYLRTKGDNASGRDFIPVTIDGEGGSALFIGKMIFKSTIIGNTLAFLSSLAGFVFLIISLVCAVLIFVVTNLSKNKEQSQSLHTLIKK